jgi:NitT/TauT family transport system substrate-binding protein
MRRRAITAAALLFALTAVVASCGRDSATEGPAAAASSEPTTVRLGYFPNITHATAILGVDQGIFAAALGRDRLETTTFNAGPAATEALLSNAIDAAYIGPSPTVNAWARSKALTIISGATSGGASLVVKPSITSAAQLDGATIATPQLGNTQDVALRHWLKEQGLASDTSGGGDVSITPQENSQTLDSFKAGDIDGAWVPEPWATRLVQEGGGRVLVDEKDLWPGGKFVTTHLVVRTEFLEQHPGTVRRLLEAQIEANELINANTEEAQNIVNDAIGELTGKPLRLETIRAAWSNLTFTNDPAVASLSKSAAHAVDVGLLEPVDLEGIYDLAPLNALLEQAVPTS